MRTGLVILFYFLFTTGCKSRNKVPHGIIPGNKMEMVMWDMIRADEFLTAFVLNKDSSLDRKTESIKLYEQIFRIHHISKEDFQKSLSFYRTHPSLLRVMMDSLNSRQRDTSFEQKKPKQITDSLPFRKRRITKHP